MRRCRFLRSIVWPVSVVCLAGSGCSHRRVGIRIDGDAGTGRDGGFDGDGGSDRDGEAEADRAVPPPQRIPCATEQTGGGPLGRLCAGEADCPDLPGGRCAALVFEYGQQVQFCTRRCSNDAECGAGATCQVMWCWNEPMCMPEGCCHGPSYCARNEICVVNRPGGLCPDGPCCDQPAGTFTCRLLCEPGSTEQCPADVPVCTSVQVGTEDYVESFDVCLPRQ